METAHILIPGTLEMSFADIRKRAFVDIRKTSEDGETIHVGPESSGKCSCKNEVEGDRRGRQCDHRGRRGPCGH